MSDYIKREDALNAIALTTMENVADAPMFLRLIGNIQSADVEPVIHAKWRDGKCTNCDCYGLPRYDGENEYTIRCPNCGAHMV